MACGEPHPDFILNKLTSRQLTECIAYHRIEPFGHDTLYFLIGQLTSIIYNSNRGKNAPAKKPWDFIPFIKPFSKKQSSNEMLNLLKVAVSENDPTKKPKVKEKIVQTKRYKKRMRELNKNKNE